jgi:hypothetical protein
MKSRFEKCENGLIQFWSETIYKEFSISTKHDFGLLDMLKNLSSQIFNLDIENLL